MNRQKRFSKSFRKLIWIRTALNLLDNFMGSFLGLGLTQTTADPRSSTTAGTAAAAAPTAAPMTDSWSQQLLLTVNSTNCPLLTRLRAVAAWSLVWDASTSPRMRQLTSWAPSPTSAGPR